MNMVSEIKGSHLWFDGCDTVELAKEFGTPLYVMWPDYASVYVNSARIETILNED